LTADTGDTYTGSLTSRLPDVWPRAVIFDMDGLMLDSERVDRDIWRAVVSEHGFDFPNALHGKMVGRSEVDSNQLISEHFGADFPLTELRMEVKARWQLRIAQGGLPPKPGLIDLLEFLESVEMPTAVATSTERSKAILCLGDFAPRFQAMAFGNEVSNPKPAPDLYLLAANRLGVKAADCLALEDSPAGHTAATAAGMTTVLVPDLVLPITAPLYHSPSLTEVERWLHFLHAQQRAGPSPSLY
jgi:HAD superfamily hydrolase (TIGR01509 family)